MSDVMNATLLVALIGIAAGLFVSAWQLSRTTEENLIKLDADIKALLQLLDEQSAARVENAKRMTELAGHVTAIRKELSATQDAVSTAFNDIYKLLEELEFVEIEDAGSSTDRPN